MITWKAGTNQTATVTLSGHILSDCGVDEASAANVVYMNLSCC